MLILYLVCIIIFYNIQIESTKLNKANIKKANANKDKDLTTIFVVSFELGGFL